MREFSPFTGCPDGILRPAEEDCDLSNIKRSRAVVEHVWNTNVVHAWGWLVNLRPFRC